MFLHQGGFVDLSGCYGNLGSTFSPYDMQVKTKSTWSLFITEVLIVVLWKDSINKVSVTTNMNEKLQRATMISDAYDRFKNKTSEFMTGLADQEDSV